MITDVSNVLKHFPSAEGGFSTTTVAPVSSGATSVQLASVAGYTNGEVAVFIIDPNDANKKQVFTGTINTASTSVTGVVWTSGTNQAHAAGATVVDYATATHVSMMTKGILVEHNQDGTHTTDILERIYPVGSVYVNASVSTNPATLLGFGTWTAFGAGRVMVGLDSGDTDFDTVGETGGAKTVAGASHLHGEGSLRADLHATGGSNLLIRRTGDDFSPDVQVSGITVTGYSGADAGFSTNVTGDTGSTAPTATSVVQPYITVYMWKRTG